MKLENETCTVDYLKKKGTRFKQNQSNKEDVQRVVTINPL